MGVIIVAALGLLVLVILATLILRAGGQIGRGTSCEAIQGAFCAEDDGTADTCPQGFIKDVTRPCADEGSVCCTPSPVQETG